MKDKTNDKEVAMKFVAAVGNGDKENAYKLLEKIMRKKVSKRVDDALRSIK